MAIEIPLRIVLLTPPAGVDYGVQHGKGNDYTTILTQRSTGADLTFAFTVTLKNSSEDDVPNLSGPLSQGPAKARFVYIDIGTCAGQTDTVWSRRLKVPLGGITWELIRKVTKNSTLILEARLPGTGKDGGPSCATIQPIEGWKCRPR